MGGHIALIGVLTGFAGSVPTAEMMAKRQTLQGLIVGSREQQQDMVRALEQWGWQPVIDRHYPLERWPRQHFSSRASTSARSWCVTKAEKKSALRAAEFGFSHPNSVKCL